MAESHDGIIVAVAWTTPDVVVSAFEAAAGDVRVVRMRSDWGVGRRTRLVHLSMDVLRVMWAARRSQGLVLHTVGAQAFVAGAMRRLAPRLGPDHLVVSDFLCPASAQYLAAQRWALGGVDRWACIRTGDIAWLHEHFLVPSARTSFVHFPSAGSTSDFGDPLPFALPASFVYASGQAHRDWDTLVAALRIAPVAAVISVPDAVANGVAATLPDRVTVLPLVAPHHGRALALRASVVVVALKDTHLPAGPLVLVDALAAGAAIVATDANGSRDYVVAGSTASVVPAGDAPALARAIQDLMSDQQRRSELGRNARTWANLNLRVDRFVQQVLGLAR